VAEKQTQQVGGGGNRDMRRQKQQDAKQNKKEKKTEKPPIAATSKAQILKSRHLKRPVCVKRNLHVSKNLAFKELECIC
jgi:hypothetical protein